jgi:FkbM family methyltransferase
MGAGISMVESFTLRVSDEIPPFFVRPEYLYRPSQLGRRVWRQLNKSTSTRLVTLPWGVPLLVEPEEFIGGNIWRTGVYDLIVLEALIRLADPGELALDVGANIGLMTSALAYAVGPTGHVISFEPHPDLVRRLQRNAELWRSRLDWAHVVVDPVALSDSEAKASLTMPADFAKNRGRATLEPGCPGEGLTVSTKTLDGVLGTDQFVGVIKIDVEGHERSVLTGATNSLSSGQVRDILFEEYNKYPTPVTRLLEAQGYQIFGLRKNIFAPRLTPSSKLGMSLVTERTANYLATRDPLRAARRLTSMGWQALRG